MFGRATRFFSCHHQPQRRRLDVCLGIGLSSLLAVCSGIGLASLLMCASVEEASIFSEAPNVKNSLTSPTKLIIISYLVGVVQGIVVV